MSYTIRRDDGSSIDLLNPPKSPLNTTKNHSDGPDRESILQSMFKRSVVIPQPGNLLSSRPHIELLNTPVVSSAIQFFPQEGIKELQNYTYELGQFLAINRNQKSDQFKVNRKGSERASYLLLKAFMSSCGDSFSLKSTSKRVNKMMKGSLRSEWTELNEYLLDQKIGKLFRDSLYKMKREEKQTPTEEANVERSSIPLERLKEFVFSCSSPYCMRQPADGYSAIMDDKESHALYNLFVEAPQGRSSDSVTGLIRQVFPQIKLETSVIEQYRKPILWDPIPHELMPRSVMTDEQRNAAIKMVAEFVQRAQRKSSLEKKRDLTFVDFSNESNFKRKKTSDGSSEN